MKKIPIIAASLAFSAATAPAVAEEILAASKSTTGTRITFAMPSGYFNATLSVAGPDGRVISVIQKSGPAAIDIGGPNAMGDGIYTYQLNAASPKTKAVKADGADGRAVSTGKVNMRGEMQVHVGAAVSGTFTVRGGRIVDTSSVKED